MNGYALFALYVNMITASINYAMFAAYDKPYSLGIAVAASFIVFALLANERKIL